MSAFLLLTVTNKLQTICFVTFRKYWLASHTLITCKNHVEPTSHAQPKLFSEYLRYSSVTNEFVFVTNVINELQIMRSILVFNKKC